MKRYSDERSPYALSAFLAVSGGVLAVVVGAFALREIITPRTQIWTVWTNTALVMLGLLAIALWVSGHLISTRVHRSRRDRAHTFLTPAERAHVFEAIKRFENRTSGEIRVHLAQDSSGEPTLKAVRAFERLGLTRTRERNGVLLFVSVRDRRVAVVGDTGIHQMVGDGFWAEVVHAIERHFSEGRFAEGLVAGIELAGARLTEHFPHRSGDTNELPDTISED